MDLLCNPDGSFALAEDDLVPVSDIREVEQECRFRLQFWKGEDDTDPDAGFLDETIVGAKSFQAGKIQAAVRVELQKVDGMLAVGEVRAELDHATRVLTVEADGVANDGPLTVVSQVIA